MSGSKKSSRRRRTAAEKLRIVLAGMDPNVEVSAVCRREGIHPTQYYGWRKHLLSSADRVFNESDQKPSRQQQRLEFDLVRAKDVIAEITAENLDLKKTFSG